MSRVSTWLAILLLALPLAARADILNLRSGLGTVVQKNLDSGDSTRYSTVLLSTSYRTPTIDFALELPLRWDFETGDFQKDVWEREGDPLRPVKLFRYHSASGRISGGLEVLSDWTPGMGYLVRDLSGMAEIDYVLPGIRFKWSDQKMDVDAGMDRPVDPAVQAVALTYRAFRGITLALEWAVDPQAPVVFTGDSSRGRPQPDDSERLSAEAAGLKFGIVEGDMLDLGFGVHVADINGDAKGAGGELTATLDFSDSYLNRLQFLVRSVSCEGGYVPAWFDAIYPLHRWGLDGPPFLVLNPLGSTVPDRTMLSYAIGYDLGDSFSISGGYDMFKDDSMRRARFKASLREENGRGLELLLWSRADDPDVKMFSLESNLHSRVRALYNVLPHLLLNVSYDHSWSFREEEAAFRPLKSFLLGVVYDISL